MRVGVGVEVTLPVDALDAQLLTFSSKLFSMIINHFYNQGGEKAIKKITGSCKESRKFLKTVFPQVLAVIVSRWWEDGGTENSFTLFCLFSPLGGKGVHELFRILACCPLRLP